MESLITLFNKFSISMSMSMSMEDPDECDTLIKKFTALKLDTNEHYNEKLITEFTKKLTAILETLKRRKRCNNFSDITSETVRHVY